MTEKELKQRIYSLVNSLVSDCLDDGGKKVGSLEGFVRLYADDLIALAHDYAKRKGEANETESA